MPGGEAAPEPVPQAVLDDLRPSDEFVTGTVLHAEGVTEESLAGH